MTTNWPLITVLFCISIPGTIIAMKRLVYFLLADNTEELKKRLSYFAIIQTLIMVLVMSFAGSVLSRSTGLQAPILEALLQGKAGLSTVFPILLPAVFYSLLGLVVFCILYYGIISRFLDAHNLQILAKFRAALGIDGCVLYGGVVEEIIGRWGLLNLTVFFALIFTKQTTPLIIWVAIIISGLIFAAGQIPAYLDAGCMSSRRLIYSIVLLSLFQSILFGFLFWKYGLICSILAHMIFHFGWAVYDHKLASVKIP